MHINTLARQRHNRMFLREGDEGGGGGTGTEGQPGGENKEFKPPATQAEFDAIISDRLKRERSKYADYDTYKAKADQWDELARASMTDEEKTEEQIRAEVFNEVMSTQVPRAVKAEFKAVARELNVPKETLDSILEDLDLVKYATDDGEPDEEKIAKKLKPFSVKEEGEGNGKGRGPGFGQGNGHQTSKGKPGEGGLEEAKRRWPERFAQAKS